MMYTNTSKRENLTLHAVAGSHHDVLIVPASSNTIKTNTCKCDNAALQSLSGSHNDVHIVNLDLHTEASRTTNLRSYYTFCKQSVGLNVTTSSFAHWKPSGRVNGHGKVIPAVSASSSSDKVRVFFFDDNVEFEGKASSEGICNLRDVDTGAFVDFGEKQNGFRRSLVGRHTVVHHSSEYRNVIVKANLLDAMEDTDYFTSIIRTYALPNEKVIVFMDVNSTIMCSDTSAGKDVSGALLSAMFELIECRPYSSTSLDWRDETSLKLEKTRTLKHLVKDLTGGDAHAYSAFWKEDTCLEFLSLLTRVADVSWAFQGKAVTCDSFSSLFRGYLANTPADPAKSYIASSWFHLYELLQSQRTALILNSFGVDTRKVVVATAGASFIPEQVVVNYDSWSDRDKRQFENQYLGRRLLFEDSTGFLSADAPDENLCAVPIMTRLRGLIKRYCTALAHSVYIRA